MHSVLLTAQPRPELTIYLRAFSAEDPGNWTAMFAQAQAADAAGVDRLLVSDHVVFGEKLEEYGRPEIGGIAGGKQPTGPDGHWLEPVTTLAVVAGMTRRIRLRTQILLAALRRPVTLAKSAATLDVLSGGRFELGVGVGWQREEYEAAGLSFEARGRLLDHTLEVCQTLWRNQRASYDSPELQFDGIHQMPKPLQPGGVPVWVSGTVRKTTARRLARFGSGWIPWGADIADLPNAIPRMREAISAAGGNPEGLKVAGNLPVVRGANGKMNVEATMAAVPALVESGITEFSGVFDTPPDRNGAEETLRHIVQKFRDAVGHPMSD